MKLDTTDAPFVPGPIRVPWHHQPPVHSPLASAPLWRGLRAALRMGADPRPALAGSLCQWYGAEHAALLGSGTQALELAIRLSAGPVALPAYGCFDLATAAVGARLPVAFYDVDPRSLGPDLDSLQRAFALGARSAVVVTFFGVSPDWDRVRRIASAASATIIEDAAQGLGGAWRGHALGAMAPLSILSFGRGKGWTGGAGGALLVRAPTTSIETAGGWSPLAELRAWGNAVAQWCLARPEVYAIPAAAPFLHLGETRYHDPAPLRALTRAAAAMLQETRAAALQEAGERRVRAERLLEVVEKSRQVRRIMPPAGAQPGYLRLPLRVRRPILARLRHPRAARLGVAPGYPMVLAELPALRARVARPWRDRRWPGADALVRELVTLPTHSLLADDDVQELEALLRGETP